MSAQPRPPVESGVPDPLPLMHPLLRKNFGKWAWHDRPRPGVLHHVAVSGDEVWTVKAGTQRQMDVYTIRTLCDIVDRYGDGHMRFTARSLMWTLAARSRRRMSGSLVMQRRTLA